ncbi:MAG: hypothetical protein P8Q14_10630 [Vicingaceae bacterium]|nr:hypothetical protein [Vicingaceae bacterium]
MKNFDKIIKESAEQFEVPFNDAHWTEMEAKLNRINSKKKNTLLFGSAATVITLLVSAYFLFPSTSSISSESQDQTEVNTNNSTAVSNKPIVSVDKTKEEILPTQKKNTTIITLEANNTKKSASTNKQENITQTNKVINPIIFAETPAIINSQTIEKKDASISQNKKLSDEAKTSPVIAEKSTTTTSISETKALEHLPASAKRIKSIRHKAYEDEHVSKKNIKRKRGSIFRFLSFKKRLYKVPLSRKKSTKKKK